MSEQHYKDLCDVQDTLRNARQAAEWAVKVVDKLRKLDIEISEKIRNIEMQINREHVL